LSDAIDILKKLQQLVSENQSLKQLLLESENMLNAKNKEIDLLQQMLHEANARQSELDIKMEELELLKHRIAQFSEITSKLGL
jgi:hypothetical protein